MISLSAAGQTAISTSAGASASSDNNAQLIGNNFNTFLKMLTTELTHQNPMSPMDTQEFTSQLVQFSEVEQLMNMSGNIRQSLQAQQSGNLLMASQMIGRSVSAQTQSLTLSGGTAPVTFTMPANVSAANLVVTDGSGTMLAELPVSTRVGTNKFSWDGKNAQGARVPDGIYTARIVARDGNGGTLEVPVTSQTTITGVQRNGDGSVSVITPGGPVHLEHVTGLN